jgi:hypothetical protein
VATHAVHRDGADRGAVAREDRRSAPRRRGVARIGAALADAIQSVHAQDVVTSTSSRKT